MSKITTVFLVIFFVSGIFILGWMANNIYRNYNYQRMGDGVWFENYNKTMVDDYTENKDYRGDWICVNIRNMSPSRAFEVCQHEVGHEIFAEYCERSGENFDKCMEIVEEKK